MKSMKLYLYISLLSSFKSNKRFMLLVTQFYRLVISLVLCTPETHDCSKRKINIAGTLSVDNMAPMCINKISKHGQE